MPLELHGRDEENVPVFTGVHEGQADGAWLFSGIVGMVLAAVFFIAGVHEAAVARDSLRSVAAFGIGALLSGGIMLASLWWYRLTREIPHLASLDDLAARAGATPEELENRLSSMRIQARARVNGQKLYRTQDFDDSLTLLQPASPPGPNPHAMLRYASSESDSVLVRPARETTEP